MSKVKTGQLGPETRERLLKLPHEFKDLLPKDTKVVGVKHGRKVGLPLNDESDTPVACQAQRRWRPHMADILIEQINRRNVPLAHLLVVFQDRASPQGRRVLPHLYLLQSSQHAEKSRAAGDSGT